MSTKSRPYPPLVYNTTIGQLGPNTPALTAATAFLLAPRHGLKKLGLQSWAMFSEIFEATGPKDGWK